jgi:hypothetical protein
MVLVHRNGKKLLQKRHSKIQSAALQLFLITMFIATHTVQGEISGGSTRISGNFTVQEEADDLQTFYKLVNLMHRLTSFKLMLLDLLWVKKPFRLVCVHSLLPCSLC